MARVSLLTCCILVCIFGLLALNVWHLAFAGIQQRPSLRGRVALGPKFLKDLGLEKPDWLPEFGSQKPEADVEKAGAEAAAEKGSSEPVESSGLVVGDDMPEIALPNQDGKLVSTSSFKSEEGPFGIFPGKEGKPVVLFFFAGSASPSCTKQAQEFRDRYTEFQSKGAEVIGISKDSVEFQKEWKKKEELPFDLLSDENGKARESLAIPKDLFGFLDGRQTYVIGADGKVKLIYNDQFGPETHVNEALAAL